jgi:DNA polymerase-3 subunit alpha
LDITQINPLRENTRTFRWRFLNPERVSVLDVDFDIEGGRRAQVLNAFRKYYGEDRVANVATFRTEKSKSAILTAARGLGIDVDIANVIANSLGYNLEIVVTSMDEMFNMLSEDKVDFIMSGLMYEEKRESEFDTSFSYLSTEYYLLERD